MVKVTVWPGGPVGQKPPFRRQSDPTADPLNELDTGGRFQTGQVSGSPTGANSAALSCRFGHRPPNAITE